MYKVKCRAAGIIIYRIRDNKPQVLGLTALKRFQTESHGIYDIPKGQIDMQEIPEECARRECYEETGLKPKYLVAGPYIYGGLWLWLAECDSTPKLGINPNTGQPEHLGYEWLDIDVIIDNCLNYLRPALVWAKGVL